MFQLMRLQFVIILLFCCISLMGQTIRGVGQSVLVRIPSRFPYGCRAECRFAQEETLRMAESHRYIPYGQRALDE